LCRFLPTTENREIARLQGKIHGLLEGVIQRRKQAVAKGAERSYGNDLLGFMLQAAGGEEAKAGFDLQSVFSNSETFYFAGQDTVVSAMGWALLLLARHPDWQERARAEVHEVCGAGNGAIDATKLNRLKIVSPP
jgi:cytochrome P450